MSVNIDPVFRGSTFRQEDVLISEPVVSVSSLRFFMVLICVIIGVGTLIDFLLQYSKFRMRLNPAVLNRDFICIVVTLNIVLHVSHYAHNIYDPAAYFEPKHLYQKVFVTEMEQTFVFNIPLSIIFVVMVRRLLLSCSKEQLRSIATPILVSIYSAMSMISGGHYTYEPPKHFSFLCNVTIAGETLLAFILLIIGWLVYYRKASSYSYQYRPLGADLNPSHIQHLAQARPSKHRKVNAKVTTDEESA